MGTFYEFVGDNNYKWDNFKGNHLNRFLSHDCLGEYVSFWKKQSLNQLEGFNEDFLRLQGRNPHESILNSFSYKFFYFNNPDCFYRINNNISKIFFNIV